MSAANNICSVVRFEREEATALRESNGSAIIEDVVFGFLDNEPYEVERMSFIYDNYHLLYFCEDLSAFRCCEHLYAYLLYFRDSITVCKSQSFFHAFLPNQLGKEALQFALTGSIYSQCFVTTGKFHCDSRSETLYWSIDTMRHKLLWAVRMASIVERNEDYDPICRLFIDHDEFEELFGPKIHPTEPIQNMSLYALSTWCH